MGLTYVPVVCYHDRQRVEVRMLVDSGASYSLLPAEVWQKLGLVPMRTISIQLADGTILRRPLSECMLEIEGERATSPVILGSERDIPLLGAISLETVGLVLNPFTRTLHPMRMLVPSLPTVPGGIESDE